MVECMARVAHTNSSTGRYHKPNRTANACTPCRTRKTRCDGRQPVCVACEKREIASKCTYDLLNAPAERTRTAARPSQPPQPYQGSVGVGNTSEPSPSTPSAEALFTTTSSNTAYVQRVAPGPSLRPSHRKPSVAALTPRFLADLYVDSYFSFSWPLVPVLERESFMQSYDSLWSANPDPAFDIIVQLVFTLGVRSLSSAPGLDRYRAAEGFFAAAKQQFNLFDVIDSPTLEDVQAMLLMVQYMHSTGDTLRCWTMHGMTVRVAQTLKLNLEGPDLIDRLNLRRCVWHCCVTLDTYNSMAFGQPMLSYSIGSTTPLPDLGSDVDGQYSPLALFVSTAALSDILSDLLNLLQEFDLKPISGDMVRWEESVGEIFKLCWRLDSFYQCVPQALRTWDETASTIDRPLYMQQQLLRCRYLLVRLLASQPLLMISMNNHDATKFPSFSLLRFGCGECLDAAHEINDRLWKTLDTPYRSTPWHATYYIFTACAVLLASTRSSLVESRPGEERFETTWEHGLAVLDHHAADIHVAGRAASVLRTMRKEIFQSEREPIVSYTGLGDPALTTGLGAGVYPNWMFGTWFNNTAEWENELDLGWMQGLLGSTV